LDTWFSSGLWTFSTLGWPEKTKDLETYHPTTVLETGHDILFFWIARMILMSQYLLGEIPFENVYLHGMVRTADGKKMSKSLGDKAIDPLDIIAKYGNDALRMAMVVGNTPGNDLKLNENDIRGYAKFTNKIWNASRFVLDNTKDLNKSKLPDLDEEDSKSAKNYRICLLKFQKK
jgi:valyl-tRNA synthetase